MFSLWKVSLEKEVVASQVNGVSSSARQTPEKNDSNGDLDKSGLHEHVEETNETQAADDADAGDEVDFDGDGGDGGDGG